MNALHVAETDESNNVAWLTFKRNHDMQGVPEEWARAMFKLAYQKGFNDGFESAVETVLPDQFPPDGEYFS